MANTEEQTQNQSSGEQGNRIALNEEQLRVLERVFPGFSNDDANADSILENLIVGFNDPNTLSNMSASSRNFDSYQVAAAYAAIYTKSTRSRYELIRKVEEARDFYLVETITQQFTEDALNPETGTGNILNVSSKNKKIQQEIDLLDERFDFDQMAQTITPDMILYGEYTLKTEVNTYDKDKGSVKNNQDGQERKLSEKSIHEQQIDKLNKQKSVDEKEESNAGLVNILDNVEQGSVIALEKDGGIDGYLVINHKGRLQKAEPADFIKFALPRTRIRIDLQNEVSGVVRHFGGNPQRESVKKELANVPRFIRVGRSIIAPFLSKIKELQLLESLIPATKISKLSNGNIVGVQLPENTKVEQGMNVANRLEQVINKKVGVDKEKGELNIENIMATSGRTKCIPMFGEKGRLEKLDFKSEEPDDLLNAVKEMRETILDSAGIPHELVFKSEGDTKSEILKRYARYLRRLKQIQKGICDGIKQMIYIHLANKGIEFDPEEISVEFENKIVEIDNLDTLEFMDTTVGMLDNLKNFLGELNEEGSPLEGRVNSESLADFLEEQLRIVGLNKVILPRQKQKENPPDYEPESKKENDPLGPEPEI